MVHATWTQVAVAIIALMVMIGVPTGTALQRFATLDQTVSDQGRELRETRTDFQTFVEHETTSLTQIKDQISDLRVELARASHDPVPPTNHK